MNARLHLFDPSPHTRGPRAVPISVSQHPPTHRSQPPAFRIAVQGYLAHKKLPPPSDPAPGEGGVLMSCIILVWTKQRWGNFGGMAQLQPHREGSNRLCHALDLCLHSPESGQLVVPSKAMKPGDLLSLSMRAGASHPKFFDEQFGSTVGAIDYVRGSGNWLWTSIPL